MHHPNVSSHSLNENLYDISISSKNELFRSLPKKRIAPRRVGLLLCLNFSPDQKRPSEYYLSKISQTSVPTLNSIHSSIDVSKNTLLLLLALHERPGLGLAPHRRPASDSSVSSGETCKDSDDALLVMSTPFDATDSRLSSITNYSTYSQATHGESVSSGDSLEPSPTGTESLAARPQIHTIAEKVVSGNTEDSEDHEQISLSLSTLTLKSLPKRRRVSSGSNDSASDTLDPSLRGAPLVPPKLRAASTSSVLDSRRHLTYQNQMPQLARQTSASSSFGLSRSKTRYYNPKETKERKQLRKKLYEENDDDELLMNDMDLVFNVPVIKNHGEIYRTRRAESTPNVLLSRNDLLTNDDNKYPYKPTEGMKPCPLPGKLSRSNLSVDRIPCSIPELRALAESDILEEIENNSTSFSSLDNDTEICSNISEFYVQRSLSYSTLARASRDQLLTDRLPNYVKTQSSLEDLSLISREKLDVVDQSRPIHLPPKNIADKAKHHRELHKLITSFETVTKNANMARENLGLLAVANQQNWFKLMMASVEPDFERKLNYDREKWRKLNWESLVSGRFRYDYLKRVLLLGAGQDFAGSVLSQLPQLERKVDELSQQMRITKDSEFNGMIEHVMQRPLFRNFLSHTRESDHQDFDLSVFRANFRRLLYLKSFSGGGLQKHHQIFVIPTFLIFFQSSQTLLDIWLLMELFDQQVFNSENFALLNTKLLYWSDRSKINYSNTVSKILRKFASLQEFEHLSSSSLFEMMTQLNDRLPLSLSAPSTPIVAQSSFQAHSKSSFESDGGVRRSDVSPVSSPNDVVETLFAESSSLSLVGVFLQLLVIHSRSKNSRQKTVNLCQGFLLTIFQFYHINWNSCAELVKANKSIKLNNSSDQLMNLESFLDKWKDVFKKL